MSFESRLQLSLKKGKEYCPIKDAFGYTFGKTADRIR